MKFRFSIRAMLVAMTLSAVWCAYSVNWIRQRRELIASGQINATESHDSFFRPSAPGLLRLFGEQGYASIFVDVMEGDPELDRIRRLFPEADCLGNYYLGGSDYTP